MWTQEWQKARYGIKSIQTHSGNNVMAICADPHAEIKSYSPLESKGFDYSKGPGKTSIQPKSIRSLDWPAHLAVLRFDITSQAEILEFTNRYGLLGLRNIPRFSVKHPFVTVDANTHKSPGEDPVVTAIRRSVKDFASAENNQTQIYQDYEPVDLFTEGVNEYRQIAAILQEVTYYGGVKCQHMVSEVQKLGFAGCVPHISYDNERWQWVWKFRSLLEACYFMLFKDHVDGGWGIKNCKKKGCQRPFFAHYPSDLYCSVDCRKADTVARNPDRVLKREIRAMKNAGEISEGQRQNAYRYIDKAWKTEKPTLDTFRAMVSEYLGIDPWKGKR